jgi:2',3'-cyclic-nucleotide 2'-phosphodiesterase (5'-nucleotidase family)
MQSLSRAALVLLPLGALAAAASRPARAPREMTLLVAATTDVHGHLTGWDYYANRPETAAAIPPKYSATHHWTP